MTGALIVAPIGNQLTDLATAPSSRAAYARRWQRWLDWCGQRGVCPLPAPPAALADYLVERHNEGHAYTTLKACAAAISVAHQAAGHESPAASLLVRKTLQGAARSAAPARRAVALSVTDLATLVAACDAESDVGRRDRTALLVGFWGALRGDDLGGLRWEYVDWQDWGYVLSVRGKTEVSSEWRRVPAEVRGDALCPVAALWEHWERSGMPSEGSVFRWGAVGRCEVLRALQRASRRAGVACIWSAHSLRAGLVTAAHAAGCSEADIAVTTGHRSVAVLRSYIRAAELRERCVTTRITWSGCGGRWRSFGTAPEVTSSPFGAPH